MTEELAALIKRYRRTPEFMFSDLTDVKTGDTLLHSAVISASRENVDVVAANLSDNKSASA